MISNASLYVHPEIVTPGEEIIGEVIFTVDEPASLEVSAAIDGVGGLGGSGPRDVGTHVLPYSLLVPRSVPPGTYTCRAAIKVPGGDTLWEQTRTVTVSPLPRRHKQLAESITSTSETDLDDLYLAFAQTLLNRAQTPAGSEIDADLTTVGTPLSDIMNPTMEDAYQILIGYRDTESLLGLEPIDTCAFIHWKRGMITYPSYSETVAPEDEESAFEQIKHTVLLQLAHPLLYAIETAGTFDVTADQILDAYRLHRQEWSATHAHFEIIVPLLNFTMDVDHEVILSERLHLSPFTQEDKARLRARGSYTIGSSQLDTAHAKLTYTHLVDTTQPYTQASPSDQEIMDFLTALRLFKPGDVGAPLMFDCSLLRSVWLPSITVLVDSALGTSYWFVGRNDRPYHLHTDELPQVKELFTSISKLPLPKRQGLGTALHRFNLAYARDQAEDVVLDLAIALESSLLTGTTDELTYKMILRGAALLANVMAPTDSVTKLKSFYTMRSQIVHEGKLISELATYTKKIAPGGSPNKVTQECIDLVRKILQQYLIRLGAGALVAQINDQIETLIVQKLNPEDVSYQLDSGAQQLNGGTS